MTRDRWGTSKTMYRGWIVGATREEFEAHGIEILGEDDTAGPRYGTFTKPAPPGAFRCEMTDAVLETIEARWGEWYWGLQSVN